MYDPLLVKGVENFERKIEDYAKLLLSEGVNFKEGMALVVHCPTSSPDIARACVKQAYKMGASDTQVVWYDHYVDHERYEFNAKDNLNKEELWPEVAKKKYGKNVAFIIVQSYGSEFFSDLDDDRAALYNKYSSAEYESFKRGLEYPYTICVAAGPEWASTIFPDKNIDDAYVEL